MPLNEKEEFDKIERVVENTRQNMLVRIENQQKAHLEHLAKVKQDEIDKISKDKLIKKLESVDYTYDHNGKIMIVKKPNDPDMEEGNSSELIEGPLYPVIKDKGVVDSQRMFRLAKIKFRNDKKFLEDYLSVEDARKYIEFTEDDYQKEWFSKFPQFIENQRNFNIEEYLFMSEGVKLKNKQGESILKGETHSIENRMSVKKYDKLNLERNLADRYKSTQSNFNSDYPKMTLTLPTDYNDKNGIKADTFLKEASMSYKSSKRPATQNTVRSRNDK